jgi:hypothetical protein
MYISQALNALNSLDAKTVDRLHQAANGDAAASLANVYQFKAETETMQSNLAHIVEAAMAAMENRQIAGQVIDQVI